MNAKPDNATQSSFRRIMKGTAIFGGTQLVNMAAGIVKGKLTAHIIGANGMGISSHLFSTLSPIQQLFTFGLTTSAVKTLSSLTDEEERSSYVKSFRRLMLVLSLLALVCTLSGAWWLSIVTFQTSAHWYWFVTLAIAVFFLMLASAESTILQGFRAISSLAICNTCAPLFGLFVAIPLYWQWGVEGIAPSMAILGFISWCTNRFFTWKLHIRPSTQSWRTTFAQGRSMLMLGGTIMVSGLLGALSAYLINTFIGHYGSESDIGFYSAANTITLQCTTMVFTAMGVDFFPHLSSIIHNRKDAQRLICQEGETVLLLIVPISLILITLAPLVIRILLTSEFDRITFLLRAMSVCLITRAICFPLDYICIARGDNKYFFWMEGVWSNLKTVALIAGGYLLGGLDGIGIALLIGIVIEVSISIIFNHYRYGISYSSGYYQLAGILCLALLAGFAASFITSDIVAYPLMALITLATSIYAYYQIDKRINIRNLIKQKFHVRS